MKKNYCLDFLKKKDRDCYISVLFMPLDSRSDLAALYAFYLELMHISRVVKEPLPGVIRLCWWRDTLKSGQDKGNPIVAALLKMIKQHSLSLNTFFRMCEARIFDFYNDTFLDCTSFESYYDDTIAPIFRIACQILAPKEISLCFEACHHGAIALGISNLILQLPYNINRINKLYIPQDILTEVNVTREAFRCPVVDNVIVRNQIILAILILGYQYYNNFIIALDKIPKKNRLAFLLLSLLPSLFAKIEKSKVEIFEKNPKISPIRRQCLLSYTALTGKFPSLQKNIFKNILINNDNTLI